MTTLHKPTPWHLWVVGILGTLWNGFGATDYTMTQIGNRGWFSAMGFDGATTDAMLAYVDSFPIWAHAAWALGVWGGLAGSLLLLFHRRLAVPAFVVSLVGAIVSLIYSATVEVPAELVDVSNASIMYLVVAIALFLLWYAWTMGKRGVLR